MTTARRTLRVGPARFRLASESGLVVVRDVDGPWQVCDKIVLQERRDDVLTGRTCTGVIGELAARHRGDGLAPGRRLLILEHVVTRKRPRANDPMEGLHAPVLPDELDDALGWNDCRRLTCRGATGSVRFDEPNPVAVKLERGAEEVIESDGARAVIASLIAELENVHLFPWLVGEWRSEFSDGPWEVGVDLRAQAPFAEIDLVDVHAGPPFWAYELSLEEAARLLGLTLNERATARIETTARPMIVEGLTIPLGATVVVVGSRAIAVAAMSAYTRVGIPAEQPAKPRRAA